jgi:Zn-dependent peptidase ImmA (M78 family)
MTELTDPHIVEAIEAAHKLREQLDIPLDAPVGRDLLKLVEEELKIPVCVMQMPEGIAGAYLKKRGQYFIFLQADNVPTRQRFTLCHEVGHHVLGHKGRVEDQADLVSSNDPNEQQANYFASEFLHPSPAVKKWMDENVGDRKVDLKDVVLAADAFGVSTPAMLYRLSKGDFGVSRKKLDVLWALTKQDPPAHYAIAEELGIGMGTDELAGLHDLQVWPRLPSALVHSVTTAHEVGFISDDRLNTLLRKV